jgi:MFS family permease
MGLHLSNRQDPCEVNPMDGGHKASPLCVLIPVGIGTALSLVGDASLYVVLPTHLADAGITVAGVGIALSANRFIRLLLNGPMGMAYDRGHHRRLFVFALFLGACSTAIYGLRQGIWPLLFARLLWGLSWVGIWVGGNSIILDITGDDNRGRWIGLYQASFFLGSASGSFAGGVLTDMLGYHLAMIVCASIALLGTAVALVALPETYDARSPFLRNRPSGETLRRSHPEFTTQFASAAALYGVNRLAVAGILASTLGLFFQQELGDPVRLDGHSLGVATVTGLALGASTLLGMVSVSIVGLISDRMVDRWRTVAAGLAFDVAGFSLLATGSHPTFIYGIPLVALASGSNQGLATTIVGDSGGVGHRSRRLGLLFTIGDFGSAVGPPLAYAVLPQIGVTGLYAFSSIALALMLLVALVLASRTDLRAGGRHGGHDRLPGEDPDEGKEDPLGGQGACGCPLA